MNRTQKSDFSLMSWNILAPCWVRREWYPCLYDLAADYQTRYKTIASSIIACNCNIVMIQEAQEDLIALLIEHLGDNYFYEFATNNPSSSPISNGLLTLVAKNWKYAQETKIISGILDSERGEAIQIIIIPSKNIHLVNLHFDYQHPLSQAKMVRDKCKQLLESSTSVTIMAGDLNSEKDIHDQFEWINYSNVFKESTNDTIIPTYYPDPSSTLSNLSVDHVFYDPKQVKLIECGKAWDVPNRSLEDALKMLGSDHIYVWATFNFISED